MIELPPQSLSLASVWNILIVSSPSWCFPNQCYMFKFLLFLREKGDHPTSRPYSYEPSKSTLFFHGNSKMINRISLDIPEVAILIGPKWGAWTRMLAQGGFIAVPKKIDQAYNSVSVHLSFFINLYTFSTKDLCIYFKDQALWISGNRSDL